MNNNQEIVTWDLDLKNYLKDFSYDAGLPIIILLICCIFLWLCVAKKITKILITLATLLFGIFCFRKTPDILIKPLLILSEQKENKKNNLIISKDLPHCIKQANAIVVLGGGIFQENLPATNSQIRLMGLSQLLILMNTNETKRLQIPVVLTGGYTNKEIKQSEAEAMKVFLNYFIKKNNHLKVITEEESKNTYQNSAYVKNIFSENKIEKNIILITNDFHMFRARKTFEKQGFNVCPISVLAQDSYGSGIFNFNNAITSVSLMNEYFGIIGYAWKGWLKF
ncbi:YdcF family protein [Pigmentibacter sp. JX0631]|uniref:YdcF family protein n=1 Tax=Pigmentibacter sp. JX0631 TaxID=2976982 RepID=UPI0024686973|nr:YdcF family protein [Pigmentibacter sp. JX0631]WGL59860.1 YdcF family protein [Pigmentibacter sp. JX0631]